MAYNFSLKNQGKCSEFDENIGVFVFVFVFVFLLAQVKAEIGVELFLDTRINFFNVVLESLSNEYSLRKTLVYEYLMYRSSNN